MAGKGKERSARPSTSSVLNSPSLEAKLTVGMGRSLLEEGDDSGFLLTSQDFNNLNLADTPDAPRIKKVNKAQFSSPGKPVKAKRPSWGPRSSPDKGKMRLLEGVDDVTSTSQPVQIRRKERTLGGLGQEKGGTMRPRQSIFAKPMTVPSPQQDEVEGPEKIEKEDDAGDDSFYKNPNLSSSNGSVKGKIAAIEAQRLHAEARSSTYTNGAESTEQLDNQLVELKKMNEVFESYEKMLVGSSDRIENFAQRIAETNSLLDIYIDLMRQADRTQQLLLDTDWQGATEDESAHALALELAEREKRRRQEEAQQAARLVAQRKREAEQARLEEEQAEQRRTATSSVRGARGGATAARGASSARGRGTAPSATNRTSTTANNRGRTTTSTASARGTASAASGLNNRYAAVRSSGYGPSK